MTLQRLEEQRNRVGVVAVQLQVAGRKQEAARWWGAADRLDALVAEKMHIAGGAR